MSYQIAPPVSWRDILVVLFRRKIAILAVFFASLLSAVVYLTLIREETYTVGAKLLVRLGREQSAPITNLRDAAVPVITYRYQEVNSEIELLKSQNLMADVVDHFHMDRPAPPKRPAPGFLPWLRFEAKRLSKSVSAWYGDAMIALGMRERIDPRSAAIEQLTKGFDAVAQKDSNVVIVTLTLPFREGGSVVLSKLLEFYQQRRLRAYTDNAVEVYFQQEAQSRLARLQDSENQLQTFETAHGIAAIDTQKNELIAEITKVEGQLARARTQRSQLAGKQSRLTEQLKKPEPDVAVLGSFEKDSLPATLMPQLTALQREREQLRAVNLDASERIQNNRQQFRAVLSLLESHVQSVLTEATNEVEANTTELSRLKQQLQDLQQSQTAYAALRRNQKLMEESFVFFRGKHQEALSSNGMEKSNIGSVVIVDPPMDAIIPSGIRKTTILLIALGCALLGAAALTAVLEFLDSSVYTTIDIEELLGAPVIASVPAANMQGVARALLGRGAREGD